jgi:hypothetical protein
MTSYGNLNMKVVIDLYLLNILQYVVYNILFVNNYESRC